MVIFKDLNRNGVLDPYEDWRATLDDNRGGRQWYANAVRSPIELPGGHLHWKFSIIIRSMFGGPE